MGIYADALFTKTQQRVLAVLFGQSDRSFYANEIIGRAASGSGAAQRELARLEAAALVTVRRIGKQKHYQANHEAPIFAELRAIVLKPFGVADALRAAPQPLWPSVELAFVYGSLAKGSEHAGSDVDLIAVGSVPSNAQLLVALLPAQAQLGRAVHWLILDQAHKKRNLAEYEGDLDVTAGFVDELITQTAVVIAASQALQPTSGCNMAYGVYHLYCKVTSRSTS